MQGEHLAFIPRSTLPTEGGAAFGDVPALVELTRAHHEARALEVLAILRSLGQATPFEVSVAMFPHREGFSHMLGMSEALGHLDLLEDDGKVIRIEGQPHRYRPA